MSFRDGLGAGLGAGCGYKISEVLFSVLGFVAFVGAVLLCGFCNKDRPPNIRETNSNISSNMNASRMSNSNVRTNMNVSNKANRNVSTNTNISSRIDSNISSNTNLASSQSPAPNSAKDIYAVVKVQALDLLADSKIDSYKLGQLGQGDRLVLIAPTLCKTCHVGNGWYHVRFLSLDLDGWVNGNGIEFE